MFGLSDEVVLLLSFLLFMSFFAGVGLASMRVKQDTTDDYLVAGRGMHPALAALSAVSTWNSGYMFIGFIGFIFVQGYSGIWIGLVSTLGQAVAWIWLYKFIQKEGNERGVRSLSSLVSKPQVRLKPNWRAFFQSFSSPFTQQLNWSLAAWRFEPCSVGRKSLASSLDLCWSSPIVMRAVFVLPFGPMQRNPAS